MPDTTLTFPSGDQTLAGTLTTPAGDGPFPVALLLPGSGPVDRDSDHRRMPLGISRRLAESLLAAGVATFRYDKRGVGASSGRWHSTGFHDNVDDARAALDLLAGHPAVDRSRIVVVGHSEGALLATALAGDRPDLAGVVLLSGSAAPGEQVLRWQTAQIAPTLPAPVRVLLRVLRTDLERKAERNRVRIRATTTDVARIDGTRVNARWTREFMAYDPRPDLARITVPVLALTGGKDLQVDPSDLDEIAALVRGPVETHRVPDVNHILRPQPGPASLSTYRTDVRGPLDPRVTAHVVEWVQRRTDRAASPATGTDGPAAA